MASSELTIYDQTSYINIAKIKLQNIYSFNAGLQMQTAVHIFVNLNLSCHRIYVYLCNVSVSL